MMRSVLISSAVAARRRAATALWDSRHPSSAQSSSVASVRSVATVSSAAATPSASITRSSGPYTSCSWKKPMREFWLTLSVAVATISSSLRASTRTGSAASALLGGEEKQGSKK